MRSQMRLFTALVLCAAGSALLPGQTIAKPPAETVVTDPAQITARQKFDLQPFSIDRLYMTRSVGSSTWSPDDKQVAFVTNISGRNNIWVVPSEGGWPVQLTVSDQRQTDVSWSPDNHWIAYTSDYGGNEQWDIFLVSPANGQVINLTSTPEISEEGPVWSPDGQQLAFMRKPKDSPSYEIEVMDVLTRKMTEITRNTPRSLGNFNPIWSRDGKHLVFTQEAATEKDSNIFIADLATGKLTNLTAHSGETNFLANDISPDGKRVLLTSNAHNNGLNQVALLDIGTRQINWLTGGEKDNARWEATAGKFSSDGDRVTWTINRDGNVQLFVYDLKTKQARPLPAGTGINAAAGAERAFSRDGRRLLYYHEGPDAPNDLWVYNFAAGKSQQITHSLVAGIRGEDMVQPFLVHYPSKDGRFTISALVYVPYNAEKNGQNAAIVYVHGGPTSQSVNSFNRNIQYLVNQGYFIIAPNYRGSTGYGKPFMDANRFDMGGGDLQDVVAAADWIKRTAFIDPKKLVVMGGSYGGYLTMMAVTKAPDLWAAGVPIVPFVNWFTEVQNEDPLLHEYDLATMGDPMKEKARYHDRSPIYFVDQIKAPLLILAGSNDPRCPATEAEQVASAIKKRNGVVELKIYENEGHGFARLENQLDAYTRIADFLKKYAPPAKCGCNIY